MDWERLTPIPAEPYTNSTVEDKRIELNAQIAIVRQARGEAVDSSTPPAGADPEDFAEARLTLMNQLRGSDAERLAAVVALGRRIVSEYRSLLPAARLAARAAALTALESARSTASAAMTSAGFTTVLAQQVALHPSVVAAQATFDAIDGVLKQPLDVAGELQAIARLNTTALPAGA